MPTPPAGIEFKGEPEDYPDTWTEAAKDGSLRPDLKVRPYKLEEVSVLPSGNFGSWRRPWMVPAGKLSILRACGETTTSRGSDIYRLAGLNR